MCEFCGVLLGFLFLTFWGLHIGGSAEDVAYNSVCLHEELIGGFCAGFSRLGD